MKRFHPVHGDARTVFQRLGVVHGLAAQSIFLFYMFSVYISYTFLGPLHLQQRNGVPDYQWPVKWIEWLGVEAAPQLVGIALFLSAMACTLKTGSRIARIVFAVLAWMGAALAASYGSVSHTYHIWIWIAVFLVLAPTDLSPSAPRKQKLTLLAAVTGAQFYILLTYTMAGINKVKGGLAALGAGEAGNFSWVGFAAQIADRMLQSETAPFAADFIISNPAIVAPMFWLIIFAQLFALGVLFFPRLHRSFGFLMIGFHFGTWALMEITFPLHVAWLMIFFVFSPFRPRDISDSPIAIARDVYVWLVQKLSAPAKKEPSPKPA